MKEWVAEFLLKENFNLTALEFYQELLENGQELKLLKDFFENKSSSEERQTFSFSSSSSGYSQDFEALNNKAIKSELKKKDDQIAILEYELKLATEDVARLKSQLSEILTPKKPQQKKPKIKNDSNNNDDRELDAIDDDKQGADGLSDDEAQSEAAQDSESTAGTNGLAAAIKDSEKKIINYMVKKYLMQHDYKLSAITFEEEVTDMDAINLDDIFTDEDSAPEMLFMYRYYFQNQVAKEKERDSKELRNALSEIEKKNAQIASLQSNIIQQENEIDDLAQKVIKLESENRKLREELDAYQNGNGTPVNRTRSPSMNNIATERHHAHEEDDERSNERRSKRSERERLIAQERKAEQEQAEQSVVNAVAEKLPSIIDGVKVSMREELIPIILAVIQRHHDEKTRDSLSRGLFNLIKKPNAEQRQIIMNGCVNLARKISPERVEAEVLPQCWEQISHKYPERRVLVAESCGALAPYVNPIMRSSLIISILQQLMEDSSAMVREAVAKNFAKVVQCLDNGDKYQQITRLFFQLLFDSDETVVAATKNEFLPVLLSWSSDLNLTFSGITSTFLTNIENVIEKNRSAEDPTRKLSDKGEKLIITMCSCFGSPMFMKILRRDILNSTPAPMIDYFNDREANKMAMLSEKNQKKFVLNRFLEDGDNDDLANFEWPPVDWITCELVPRLLSWIVSLDVCNMRVRSEIAKTVNNLCKKFGYIFTQYVVKPAFLTAIDTGNSTGMRFIGSPAPERNRLFVVRERVLPIYLCTVAAIVSDDDLTMLTESTNATSDDNNNSNSTNGGGDDESDEDGTSRNQSNNNSSSKKADPQKQQKKHTQFSNYLHDLIVNVSVQEEGWSTEHLPILEEAIRESSKMTELQDELLSEMWNLVVHPAIQVRTTVVRLFKTMMTELDSDQIAKRVLPAFITLGSDIDRSVRMAALKSLGSLIINVSSNEKLFDKISAQFDSYIDDPYRDFTYEVLKVFANIMPTVATPFRENVILPKVFAIGNRNNLTTNLEDKKDTAVLLFDAYRALNGCVVSDNSIAKYVAPGLRLLLNDADYLDNSYKHAVTMMIKDFTSGGSVGAGASTSSSSSSSLRSTSTTSSGGSNTSSASSASSNSSISLGGGTTDAHDTSKSGSSKFSLFNRKK